MLKPEQTCFKKCVVHTAFCSSDDNSKHLHFISYKFLRKKGLFFSLTLTNNDKLPLSSNVLLEWPQFIVYVKLAS